MKQLLFTILLSTFSSSHGQTVANKSASVFVTVDKKLVYRYKDSLLIDNTNEVIVFQTQKKFEYLKSSDSIITFIIWRQNNNYFTVIVTDKKIFSPISFKAASIFNFPLKTSTFVTKDEKKLKFVPPIIGNVVYFFTKTTSNYFELTGTNSQPWTYVTKDRRKEFSRKHFFDIIYKTL